MFELRNLKIIIIIIKDTSSQSHFLPQPVTSEHFQSHIFSNLIRCFYFFFFFFVAKLLFFFIFRNMNFVIIAFRNTTSSLLLSEDLVGCGFILDPSVPFNSGFIPCVHTNYRVNLFCPLNFSMVTQLVASPNQCWSNYSTQLKSSGERRDLVDFLLTITVHIRVSPAKVEETLVDKF